MAASHRTRCLARSAQTPAIVMTADAVATMVVLMGPVAVLSAPNGARSVPDSWPARLMAPQKRCQKQGGILRCPRIRIHVSRMSLDGVVGSRPVSGCDLILRTSYYEPASDRPDCGSSKMISPLWVFSSSGIRCRDSVRTVWATFLPHPANGRSARAARYIAPPRDAGL